MWHPRAAAAPVVPWIGAALFGGAKASVALLVHTGHPPRAPPVAAAWAPPVAPPVAPLRGTVGAGGATPLLFSSALHSIIEGMQNKY